MIFFFKFQTKYFFEEFWLIIRYYNERYIIILHLLNNGVFDTQFYMFNKIKKKNRVVIDYVIHNLIYVGLYHILNIKLLYVILTIIIHK